MKFIFLISTLFLVGCQGWHYQPDNLVEEIVEEAIKAETGVDVDLSPSTPEKGFSPHSLEPFKKS